MKKLILTVITVGAVIGASISAQAQGRIVFGNASVPTQKVLDGRPGANFGLPIFGPAGTYEYGLYIGAAGATEAQLTLVGTAFSLNSTTTAAPAGLFNGGNPYVIPATAGVTLDGSVPIAFEIKGWTASYGSSYDAALANNLDGLGLFGKSILGSVTPTASPTPAPNIFGVAAGNIQSFSLSTVPEPGTLALAGLGAASLLLFRRRK